MPPLSLVLSPWDKYHHSVSSVALDWLISIKGYQLLNEGGSLESSYDWQSLASHLSSLRLNVAVFMTD